MLRFRFILTVGLLASFGIVQAQTPLDAKPDSPQNVNQRTIQTDEITLIKDSGIDPLNASPAQSLQRAYGVTGSQEKITSMEDLRQTPGGIDVNKIRVIKQAGYDQMNAEQQAAVDADPYWIISEDTRRQVIADVFTGKIEIDLPAEAPTAEPVPVQKQKPQATERPD